MDFQIDLSPDAWKHIQALPANSRVALLDAIEQQLKYQPDQETHKRKRLKLNALAGWELRLGSFRIFYDVLPSDSIVLVLAIGIKDRSQLFIGGKEVRLK